MLDKLEDLKRRTELLFTGDKKELDDIRRKSKMYLERLFSSKFTYASEVDLISFSPTYIGSYTTASEYLSAWSQGKQELINLLDTRIEEYNLLIRQSQDQLKQIDTKPKEVQMVEKIIKVEDTSKIEKLTEENANLRAKKRLWERINWSAVVSIGLTVIGGSFLFGKYVGETRFDNEKIDLVDKNKMLRSEYDSVLIDNKKLLQKITVLKPLVKKTLDSIAK